MFDRFTEKSRRVIFYSRDEASQSGSAYIETEHLLLGLLREDEELAERFRQSPGGLEAVRQRIAAAMPPGAKIPTSVDMPLSRASRRVLTNAIDTADAMGQSEINVGHLALGLLSEEKCLAAEILRERGLG